MEVVYFEEENESWIEVLTTTSILRQRSPANNDMSADRHVAEVKRLCLICVPSANVVESSAKTDKRLLRDTRTVRITLPVVVWKRIAHGGDNTLINEDIRRRIGQELLKASLLLS